MGLSRFRVNPLFVIIFLALSVERAEPCILSDEPFASGMPSGRPQGRLRAALRAFSGVSGPITPQALRDALREPLGSR